MSNLMPAHYKDLRDELDCILWHFDVPKAIYFRLLDLRKHVTCGIEINNGEDSSKIMRALEIIEEIMPQNRNGNSP